MAQAKKSDFHKLTSLKGESPGREGNCAIYQKPFAHHNQRHHQKDPPLTTLAVKGSESATISGSFVVPILSPPQRIKDGNLGSDTLVNILSVPQHIILVPLNLLQGQMTPIPEYSASRRSLVPYSYSRDRPTKHSYVRSKRSKSGKIPSRDWQQNNYQQNDCCTLMQSDSRQEISEVLDDENTRLNRSVKRNPRKKGKKKGKHSKVFTQVCKEEESVLEPNLHVVPDIKKTVNNVSCLTDVSENTSSHTSISSCLSVQISNGKPEGDEYSYNHIEYIGSPSPMATSNSDEMTEMEPTASFSEEFAFNGYHYSREGSLEPSSNQTCSLNAAQPVDMVSSTTSKNVGVCSNQSSSCDDTSYSYYSGQDTNHVSDLLVDEWGSDNCSSYHAYSVDTNPCHKPDVSFSPSDCQVDFPYPSSNLLDMEIPSDKNNNNNEKSSINFGRTGYVSVNEACSVSKACITVNQHCIPGKRGRHGRKSASSCNSTHWSGNQTNLGKAGKDTGHSVWQRVEKKDVEGCIPNKNMKVSSSESGGHENSVFLKNKPFLLSDLNENDDFCNLHEISSHSDGLEVACNLDNPAGPHYTSESSSLLSNIPRRVKKNPSSFLKHDSSQYCKKVNHFGKQNTIKFDTVIVDENEETGNSSGLGCENFEISDPKSFCQSSNSKSDLSLIEDVDAQSRLEDENVIVSATTLDHSQSNVNGTTVQVGKDKFNMPAREVDSWQRHYRQNVQSEGGSYISCKEDDRGFYQHCVNGSIVDVRMDSRNSPLENSKHDQTSGAVMQKWVPVGKKSMPSRGHHHNLFVTPKDLIVQKGEFNNSIQISNHEFDCDSSLSSATSACKRSGSTNTAMVMCSSINDPDGSKLRAPTLPHSPKPNTENDTLNCNVKLGTDKIDNFRVENDMQKIVRVVTDAYKFQNLSELFNLQIGSPVAEIERVLYSASPVISQMRHIAHCKSCSSGQPLGNALCRHQIPNISIQNIWQWYEKPGSYGLEVKVGNQHAKRPIASQSRFRAYFVPYLSALQLFGINSGTETSSCNVDKSANAPTLSALPIFSVLLPQPGKKLSEPSRNCPSSSEEDNLSDISLNKTGDDGELLFEYFESDSPQQRRPLFEKIRELIRGDISSNSKAFGDPSKLESLNLKDIHPASWFSVAWYPIYRIPDGNLRAAFLTYHSLGTFIQRDAKLTSSSFDIVSPVVGLQSYNAKGECWFQLNEFESTMVRSEDHFSNPSEILKERLRSLELTASVMARASVCKNDQKSVNRQPDYEFFLSRRW